MFATPTATSSARCTDPKSSEALIKSVRVEPVETQAICVKGFDKLSPNGEMLAQHFPRTGFGGFRARPSFMTISMTGPLRVSRSPQGVY